MNLSKLSEPFPAAQVSWRVGSTNGDKTKGMALAYIDARDVMDRLDKVVGQARWQDRYEVHGSKTICYLSIWLEEGPQDPNTESRNGHWVTKADGAGDSDVEAEKGSISDAFKRAAVKWGIGRYLYDLDSPWVEIEQRGRSFIIKPGEHAKLQRLLTGSARPATPETPAHSEKLKASLDALARIQSRIEVREYVDTVERSEALEPDELATFTAAARQRWQQLPAEQKEAA